jgi:TRAP-type uncharacterized transport system fused permease subunit
MPCGNMTQRLSVLALVLDVWKFTFFVSNMQEIGVLVTLFCLFHACVGLILPSLARLRTMYAKLSVLSLNFGSTYQKKKKKKKIKVLAVNFFMWICVDSSAINCVNRYVPNELRGGMMSLSLAPANAAILLFMIQVRLSLSLCLFFFRHEVQVSSEVLLTGNRNKHLSI